MTPEAQRELLDRTRRIETRLTRYLSSRGFDVENQKPHYDERLKRLSVPSRKVAIQECLDAIPCGPPVGVYIGAELLGWFEKNVEMPDDP
jgi:hypothetical protein